MSKRALEKVLAGLSDENIKFSELREILLDSGFAERIKGDHHIFTKDKIVEIINIQPLRNEKAKAYQVKQVRNLILKYKLHEGVKDV
ncbi:MAG: type II toxin-antitoxin system HicA family toxin [Dehalococcoidia bacterium]|nr:type II toxin-antitoxin system HicA family toxin [Dehalococcoidia bacterium]